MRQELLELRGAYRRGEYPPNFEAVLYAMAVDIQDGFRLKATKALFDKAGNMAVIDWGEFVSLEEMEDWADIPLETPTGPIVVQCGVLDEGNDKEDVWRYHLETRPRFWPMKGRGGRQVIGLVDGGEVENLGLREFGCESARLVLEGMVCGKEYGVAEIAELAGLSGSVARVRSDAGRLMKGLVGRSWSGKRVEKVVKARRVFWCLVDENE